MECLADSPADDWFEGGPTNEFVLLPKLSFNDKEGDNLVTKTVYSSLLLAGVDPDTINVDGLSMETTKDGSAFLETSIDIGNSLLFHPAFYNKVIGEGTPRFDTDSSRMVAFREAVEKKKDQHGTVIDMVADLPTNKGSLPFYIETSVRLLLGRRTTCNFIFILI